MSDMPAEVKKLPLRFRIAYRFNVANPDIMKQIPCYCGCGDMGHASNYACFVQDDTDGKITFDSHALGCSICVDITIDTMRMLKEGKSVTEIKQAIDDLRKVWPEQYQVNAQKTSVHTDRLPAAALVVAFAPVPVSHKPTERVIRVEAADYAFTPSVIYANPGDQITIELISKDVVHGLSIDGYPAIVLQAEPGRPARTTFVAEKSGLLSFVVRSPVEICIHL